MMPNSSAVFWLSTRFCAMGHLWASLGPLSWPCPLPAPGAPPGTLLAGQYWELAGPWPQVSTALECPTHTCSCVTSTSWIQTTAPYRLLTGKLTVSQLKPGNHGSRVLYLAKQIWWGVLVELSAWRTSFNVEDTGNSLSRNGVFPAISILLTYQKLMSLPDGRAGVRRERPSLWFPSITWHKVVISQKICLIQGL